MSITTTALADSLSASVPKLDPSGQNWAIFSVRFQDAVEAKGFWGHFDGSDPRPTLSSPATDAEIAEETQWVKNERSAKSLLTQKIPDGTLMRIHTKMIIKLHWDMIVLEYTEKGDYAKMEMRAKFLKSKCLEKGDTRDFLMDLQVKREELAKVGVSIDDKDYLSTIISSLPIALSNFAAAHMFLVSKSINPNVLISLLMEEVDRQKSQQARRHSPKKETDGEGGEVLSTEEKGRKEKGKRKVECWDCGEKGHIWRNCPKSKSSDEKGEGDKGDTKGDAAGAAESDSEGEGAWCMEEDPVLVNFEGAEPASQISGAEDKGTASSNEAEKEGDWFLDAIREQEELEAAERSAAALVTESDEKQVSALLDKAKGEVDWFSEVAEESDKASDDEWDSDDKSSAEDHRDLSQVSQVACKPVTPTNEMNSCPIGTSKLVVNVLDSAEDLQSMERDMEQPLDMYGNPLYSHATGGSNYSITIANANADLEPTKRDTEQALDMPLPFQKSGGSYYSIANIFWPPGLPDNAHPQGNHKGGELGGKFVGEEAKFMSAARFEGEYDELGETAPNVPWIPFISVPDNPRILWVQLGATTTANVDLEGEGIGNLAEMANSVDLDMKVVDGKVGEVFEPQCGNERSLHFDFVSTDWEEGTKFALVEEMGGLVEDLPVLGEIVHTKEFSCGKKGAGVKDDEIKGQGTPQNVPNVEIFKIFKLGLNFTSILVMHEIRAAGDVKNSQKAFGIPNNVGEHTLDPTKHPPGGVAIYPNHDPALLYQYKQVQVKAVAVSIQVTGEPEYYCGDHKHDPQQG